MRASVQQQLSNAQQMMVAQTIVEMMRERDIAPDVDYTAAAGADYGLVRGWELPGGDGVYAIAYGDGGQTDYALDTDPDQPLADWLLHPDGSPLEIALEQANVLGLDAVEAATGEEEDNDYMILYATPQYGGDAPAAYDVDDQGRELAFGTLAEAQAYVSKCEEGTAVLAHNQSGAHRHKIVAIAR